MALADMLLGMVWPDLVVDYRERLFDRIGRDLRLSAEDRVSPSVTSNYGGLLMLAWLLEGLPAPLGAVFAIMKAAPIRRPVRPDDGHRRLRGAAPASHFSQRRQSVGSRGVRTPGLQVCLQAARSFGSAPLASATGIDDSASWCSLRRKGAPPYLGAPQGLSHGRR
jgi:hypothetical protein